MNEDILTIKNLLSTPKRILITTHYKPDGDALGSSLGLYHYLVQQNHSVSLIAPSDYPDFLSFLPSENKVMNYEMNKKQAAKIIDNAEILFCLDFNDTSRTGSMALLLNEAKGIKIMIDHHLNPSNFYNLKYWNDKAAATCELIYDFIVEMGSEHLINEHIATALYTGLMTDTGSFRFACTTPKVHRTAANLMEKGAKNDFIHAQIYDSNSFDRLQMIGYCLINNLSYLPEYKTAVIVISLDELQRFHSKTGDTEGLVNYGLSIKGAKMACLVVDRVSHVKLSFRSKGSVPANEFASLYFGGGGHKNAAGGQTTLNLIETQQLILDKIPDFFETFKTDFEQ